MPAEPPSAAARLLGVGRTCDVWDLGDGTVLRRYRDGRDAGLEAQAMQRLADAGVPVPVVDHTAGPDIVMEKVIGPTLLQRVSARPWTVRAAARLLRELLAGVAATPAPDGLRTPFGPGEATLHLDLHPGNVILAAQGPVIIDWDNVARGPAGADVAQSWMLVRVSQIPAPLPSRLLLARLQSALAAVIMPADDPAGAYREAVLRRRLSNANVTPVEVARIEHLLAG